jgi:hypothetical protein
MAMEWLVRRRCRRRTLCQARRFHRGAAIGLEGAQDNKRDKGLLMNRKGYFARISVKQAGVLLTGAQPTGASTSHGRTQEVNDEPAY